MNCRLCGRRNYKGVNPPMRKMLHEGYERGAMRSYYAGCPVCWGFFVRKNPKRAAMILAGLEKLD